MADEKKKVYLLSIGDYKKVAMTDISGVTEWIKADSEMLTNVNDALEIEISIAYMTEKEIENLPEVD